MTTATDVLDEVKTTLEARAAARAKTDHRSRHWP